MEGFYNNTDIDLDVASSGTCDFTAWNAPTGPVQYCSASIMLTQIMAVVFLFAIYSFI